MALGHNFQFKHKRCWYEKRDKESASATVTIPYRQRDENMSLKDKWHVSEVEKIFESYKNIVAFHIMYNPRPLYE